MARTARHDPEWRPRLGDAVLAALVHDAGMLRVPVSLLTHPGPLDGELRRQIESHCRVGAELAARLLPNADWLAKATREHHERLDGTGYPDGLRAGQLTSLSRLLAVCDVYAAFCVPRAYRPAKGTRTGMADTLLFADQGLLDRDHAERLLHLSFYPVGAAVELADGAQGVVASTPPPRRDLNNPARPVVVLLMDGLGEALPTPRPLDLAQCDDRSIVRTLSPAERRELLGSRFPEWV
jgi:HD-GYP domain-containing protein (c-di-GMP phosphodiesterase class II)